MGFKLTARGEEYPRRVFPDRPTIGTSSPPKTGDFLPGGNTPKRDITSRTLDKDDYDCII
jgi:hypothetical protein